MKFKTYPIQIWFLDDNLRLSVEYLTNKYLCKTINGCFQAICNTYFYCFGIKNKKFYNYFFDKLRKVETMDKFFPDWPLKSMPKFQNYMTRQSKWCRKCNEHFEYIKNYFNVLLDEYEYRFAKKHKLFNFLNWIKYDAPEIKIPNANIKKITIEWKSLNPKYRRKNIVEGYRLQYSNLLKNYGISIDDFTKRDIPIWLMNSYI